MNLGLQSQKDIMAALQTAIGKLAAQGGNTLITDIHLQPVRQAAELFILDDEDQILASTPVAEWVDCDFEAFYTDAETQLRPLVKELQQSGQLDALPLFKPYSFVLVDGERETVCELLLVDDDTVILSNELLKGLDEELDDFLKKLLAE